MAFIKGYKQSEEQRKKIGISNSGKIRSEEVKKRISETHLKNQHLYKIGHRFKKGGISPTLGKTWKAKGRENLPHSSSKEYKRDTFLKSFYGISLADYNLMLENQQSSCLICNDKKTQKGLVVDHNHTTGKVRGLLCYKCNLALGLLRENEEIILSLLNYLKLKNENEA
jgi:hypothetical protein